MTRVVVVYHSVGGRTRALAQAVGRGAESIGGVAARVLSVEEAPREQAALAEADAIVLGCPTYMGSVSGAMKTFMDGTSAIWALQGFRDKLAAGFTHSAAPSGDKLGTLVQLAVFAAQHGMVWVGLGLPPSYASADAPHDDVNRLGSHLGAMAQSRPGGGALHPGDVRTAEHLGRRVAEAAKRWRTGERSATEDDSGRHPTARGWTFPPPERDPRTAAFEHMNLREIVARKERFEHHLLVAATIDGAQLEVVTASEPLAFAHINCSDEWAVALPTGDDLVDRFPYRTFLTDPTTGEDVGRYNHRAGDFVLHPQGLLHWPGRLRPPYEVFAFPPGMRRCGVSVVYCAGRFTPHGDTGRRVPAAREADAKAYATPEPPMVIAPLSGGPGRVGHVGTTTLELIERPRQLAPTRGGYVLVLEADAGAPWCPCDLVRVPEGGSLAASGIARALLFASEVASPDPAPPLWRAHPPPPFAPFEEAEPGTLPFECGGLRIERASDATVTCAIGDGANPVEVPRHWLARMLFREALHGMRLGYVETYGGLYVDDRGEDVRIGLRRGAGRAEVRVPRAEAGAVLERMYRAVAPAGYRERIE